MPYQLVFTEQYIKRAARFLKRHPELGQQYLKTLQLLEVDPFHPPCVCTSFPAGLKVCTRFPSICPTG